MLARHPRPASLVLAGTVSLGLALMSGPGSVPAQALPSATAARAPAATGKHLVRGPHREGAAASVADYTSSNWDGYFTTAASHGTDFTAISATWTEAAVTCGSKAEAWAGFWIGMDGWWNDVVEQGGSEAQCLNGKPQYHVWWEMYPFNSVQTSFAIKAGDTIHARVTHQPTGNKFDIVVKDVTSGKTLTKDVACQRDQDGCPRTSADVISEDIGRYGGNSLFPLPDYGTETYRSVSVTNTSGHTGSLSNSAWQLGKVTEVSSGVTKQTTSGLTASGTSFTTTWHHR